jgi:hypothetical protein
LEPTKPFLQGTAQMMEKPILKYGRGYIRSPNLFEESKITQEYRYLVTVLYICSELSSSIMVLLRGIQLTLVHTVLTTVLSDPLLL